MKTVNFAPGTKPLKSVFVTLIFLTVLISDAFPQYKKLLKGEPNPFDTAVAVRIDRYRMEGRKLALGQQLVDSLVAEIKSLHSEVKVGDSINRFNASEISILTKANIRKDSVNRAINDSFDKLTGIVEKQNKWYRRPEVWGGAIILFELLKLLAL